MSNTSHRLSHGLSITKTMAIHLTWPNQGARIATGQLYLTRARKAIRFLGHIASQLLRGEFSRALHEIALRSPRWLFRYNVGYALVADEIKAPLRVPRKVKVWTATHDDIDDIVRINDMEPETVRRYLDSGAVAFLASYNGERAGAVLFRASGRCFVEGMSWEHDFGPDGSYCFGVYTAPEARNKGLQSALVAAQARYERQLGTQQFWRLLEFTNDLAYDIAYHLGYRPMMTIYHVRLGRLRIAILKSIRSGRTALQMYTSLPDERHVLRI